MSFGAGPRRALQAGGGGVVSESVNDPLHNSYGEEIDQQDTSAALMPAQ